MKPHTKSWKNGIRHSLKSFSLNMHLLNLLSGFFIYKQIFLITHQICFDDQSRGIFIQELMALYEVYLYLKNGGLFSKILIRLVMRMKPLCAKLVLITFYICINAIWLKYCVFIANNELTDRTDIAISSDELGVYFFNGIELISYEAEDI
ncbi:MAG: hypothetical protein ABFS56_34320 [Pseudomonadota bacterium]